MRETAAADPVAGLAEMWGLFGPEAGPAPDAEPVGAGAIPPHARARLAHENHMTETLEALHGAPVRLHPIVTLHAEPYYARRLSLSNSATGAVVMYGIMRIDLRLCGAEVRRLILEGKTPLGRILIDHGVMRKVTNHAMLRLRCNAEMAGAFGVEPGRVVYGRLASIDCDGAPAVDLLEVVAPENERKNP